MMGALIAPLLASLLTGIIFASRLCSATTWTVGNASGWSLGVDYSQWVLGKFLQPGDIFLFNYDKSRHNVLEVSEEDLSSCTTARPLASYTDGNTSISIGNVSTHYYICGIPGHCLDGMSIVIDVTNGSSPAPAPAPTPAPVPSASAAPPSSTPTPSSAPSTTVVPPLASSPLGTGSPPSLAPLPNAGPCRSRGLLMALAAVFLGVVHF